MTREWHNRQILGIIGQALGVTNAQHTECRPTMNLIHFSIAANKACSITRSVPRVSRMLRAAKDQPLERKLDNSSL